jgi:hypothetical protein
MNITITSDISNHPNFGVLETIVTTMKALVTTMGATLTLTVGEENNEGEDEPPVQNVVVEPPAKKQKTEEPPSNPQAILYKTKALMEEAKKHSVATAGVLATKSMTWSYVGLTERSEEVEAIQNEIQPGSDRNLLREICEKQRPDVKLKKTADANYNRALKMWKWVTKSTSGTCYDLAWLDNEEGVMHVFSEHLKSNGNKSKQAHWDVLICLYLAYNQRDAARQERYFNNYYATSAAANKDLGKSSEKDDANTPTIAEVQATMVNSDARGRCFARFASEFQPRNQNYIALVLFRNEAGLLCHEDGTVAELKVNDGYPSDVNAIIIPKLSENFYMDRKMEYVQNFYKTSETFGRCIDKCSDEFAKAFREWWNDPSPHRRNNRTHLFVDGNGQNGVNSDTTRNLCTKVFKETCNKSVTPTLLRRCFSNSPAHRDALKLQTETAYLQKHSLAQGNGPCYTGKGNVC